MYAILADGTKVVNCAPTSTCDEIFVMRDTEAEAIEARQLFTYKNSETIKLYAEAEDESTEDVLMQMATHLKLDPDTRVERNDAENCFVAIVTTGIKTQFEILQDQINDLQDVVIALDEEVRELKAAIENNKEEEVE